METSGSSRVTVEYHDPAGVYPLVSHEITSRLPLRGLNWQSPSRPLRQIKSLFLDFVPDKETQAFLRPPGPNTDDASASSFDIVRGGKDARKEEVRERRHQIPGLKTSAYLKIYILRCDDKDSYKETEQKRIRDWIRENAQNDRQRENHDACDWMILHVVVPDTVAASEPRWRGTTSTNEAEELKERSKNNTKWPGKSTRTVFDRLRADFDESSKTGIERVAQIRLRKSDVAPDLLPTPAVATTLEESPQERENAWTDLMYKFKMLILGPFDYRVRKYEEDIAEQEARRSLPGFNFCTFFIHKEGLARALESVGLAEDALSIYDELTLDLETVLRDIASGQAEGTATTFASYTGDIEARITGATKAATENGNDESEASIKMLQSLFDKDYRQSIVTSSISVFDFFCYLFSRQKALILRLANARGSRESATMNGKDSGEDLVLLSEVCWRTSSFIHNTARTLRHDLISKSNSSGSSQTEADIESLVSSWTYAVAEQVLLDTAGSALETASMSGQRKASLPNGKPLRPTDFAFAMGADSYPQRQSSLPPARSNKWPQSSLTPSLSSNEPGIPGLPQSRSDANLSKPGGLPGQAELATYRAELILMQRKMVEQLAEQRGWFAGWNLVKQDGSKLLDDVNLDEETEESTEKVTEIKPSVSELLSPLLSLSLHSEQAFQAEYESLSYKAMHHYGLATIIKSAEAIVTDLAMLKCQQGDFEKAESYFQHLLPQYIGEGWGLMEARMLMAYSKCLKALEKETDYAKIALDLLAKVCGRIMSQKLPSVRMENTIQLEDDMIDVSGLLTEVASSLPNEVIKPMSEYFCNIQPEQEIRHLEDKDGFALGLSFRHVLDDEIILDEVRTRLVSADDPTRDIWLQSTAPIEVTKGIVNVELEAVSVAFGAFYVDKITLRANKLRFVHELYPAPEVPTLVVGDAEVTVAGSRSDEQRPFVFVYPAQKAFSAEVLLSNEFHIEKRRHLEIALDSGWNDVDLINLKLKASSAGLRLHLADATFEAVERRKADFAPGQISLAGLKPGKAAKIELPYTLEQQGPGQVISVRLEAEYQTSDGTFSFHTSAKVTADLPLDVDVKDVFHVDTLFSKFTLRTTQGMPISITDATLESSKAYEVESPPTSLSAPMLVFDKHPGKLVYKITRKASSSGAKVSKKEAALALRLQYQPYEDLINMKLREQFAKDVEQSYFASFSRFLVPLLAERGRQLSSATASRADLALAALIGQAKIPNYKDVGWDDIVLVLPANVREKLTEWLRQWHESHPTLDITKAAGDETTARCITISVDVPNVDFVHGAALSLTDVKQPAAHQPRVVTLGEPVKTQLRIKHTEGWSEKAVFGTAKKDQEKDFVYEIHAESDTWLVGGQRRAYFSHSKNGEAHTVELTLVPLRLGLHSLPLVEVHPATVDSETSDKADGQPSNSCETYYESAGQVVQVVRDLRMTKVHVDEEETEYERYERQLRDL